MYKQVNVKPDTFKKIKVLADKYDVPIYKFLGTIVQFFDQNRTIVNADFFQKSDEEVETKLVSKLEKSIQNIVRKEVNRMIGFLKVQDEYMKTIKKDIIYSFSNGEITNYHPLFIEYEYVINIYKDILLKNGFNKDIEVYEFIRDEFGIEALNNFLESEEKIKEKKMFLDV